MPSSTIHLISALPSLILVRKINITTFFIAVLLPDIIPMILGFPYVLIFYPEPRYSVNILFTFFDQTFLWWIINIFLLYFATIFFILKFKRLKIIFTYKQNYSKIAIFLSATIWIYSHILLDLYYFWFLR